MKQLAECPFPLQKPRRLSKPLHIRATVAFCVHPCHLISCAIFNLIIMNQKRCLSLQCNMKNNHSNANETEKGDSNFKQMF